jgi:hypothetical protein
VKKKLSLPARDVTVVNEWPPNIEAIRAVLPVTERNIFAYDHRIYNPGGGILPLELLAHEKVHFKQQDEFEADGLSGVEGWWELFLESPTFRLKQEIPAHAAEYAAFCRMHKDRNEMAQMLRRLAQRLAAPMYGSIITVNEAMKAIR